MCVCVRACVRARMRARMCVCVCNIYSYNDLKEYKILNLKF